MRKIIIIASIIFIVIASSGAIYFYVINPNSTTTAIASKGNIVQKVSITAKIKPLYSVDLAFEISGKVASTSAGAGEHVRAGQILAKLNTSNLEANLRQAQSNRDADQATLTELRNGAKPQDITVLQSQVNSATVDMQNSQNNLVTAIIDAYTKADDAIKNNADQLINDPNTSSPNLAIGTNSSDLTEEVKQGRIKVNDMFFDWTPKINSLISGGLLTDDVQKLTINNLNYLVYYLNTLAKAVNSNSLYSANSLNTYKTIVATARTEVSEALSTVQSTQEKYNNANSNLQISRNQLVAKKSGNTSAVIAAQIARVDQDEAQIAAVQADINKAYIRSPIEGLVTKQDCKVGQIVEQGVVETSVISDKNLYIEGYVPEINIGSISVGNPVSISIEAFPNKQFTGTVTYIDPAETILGGISNFKIKVTINEYFEGLRSGLTANIDIITGSKSNVTTVPLAAVITSGTYNFIRKITNNTTINTPVTLGIIGTDDKVEVISGVNTGDKILINN